MFELWFFMFFLHQQTVCCLSMCCPIWTPAKGNQMWDQITNRTSVWFETEHTKMCWPRVSLIAALNHLYTSSMAEATDLLGGWSRFYVF